MNAAQARAFIRRKGRKIAIRRMSGTKVAYHFEAKPYAVVRFFVPAELVGGIQQGDREVRMDPTELERRQWPIPPVKGDPIIVDGKTCAVQACEACMVGEDLAFYVIQVRG